MFLLWNTKKLIPTTCETLLNRYFRNSRTFILYVLAYQSYNLVNSIYLLETSLNIFYSKYSNNFVF